MSIGKNGCVTNQCSACKCSCQDSGGHACKTCDRCQPTDDHRRKD